VSFSTLLIQELQPLGVLSKQEAHFLFGLEEKNILKSNQIYSTEATAGGAYVRNIISI
jgi:hypothetical protein